ncbi:hypothetical protein BGZ81_005454 [Podila clonocystis]|nr:hypothetical protein BGZ81_005454 [Podila clonocystis]
MTNKAKITNLLLTDNDHRGRIRNSLLAMVIHDISEPICDPTSEEDSTLFHREEMRRQHLEDSTSKTSSSCWITANAL